MKQIKVGLPDDTREYLESFARINGRSLSEEARARIDQSKRDDLFDPATQELGRDVMWLAHMVKDSARWTNREPSWTDDPRLFESLKVAIETWLAEFEEQLELMAGEGPQIEPVTLGKATAANYSRLKKAEQKLAADAKAVREE
jgi:hypothetical protein